MNRRTRVVIWIVASVALALIFSWWAYPASARADPCEAIPERGPIPAAVQPGRYFVGPVVQVLDGDSLCVAIGQGPRNWVEVRLADFYATELHATGGVVARSALERVAGGRVAVCRADHRSYDRIVARCTISGRSVGDLLRSAGLTEGGNGRQPRIPAHTPAWTNPRPAQPTTSPSRSCAQARAAGAAPMYRGQPGYNPNLDGDGDGIACEPYRGRR